MHHAGTDMRVQRRQPPYVWPLIDIILSNFSGILGCSTLGTELVVRLDKAADIEIPCPETQYQPLVPIGRRTELCEQAAGTGSIQMDSLPSPLATA